MQRVRSDTVHPVERVSMEPASCTMTQHIAPLGSSVDASLRGSRALR